MVQNMLCLIQHLSSTALLSVHRLEHEAATYNNHTDLQEDTETVTAYIKKCIDDVTVTKTTTTRANQKPWMTAEVCGLLKTRDEAFGPSLYGALSRILFGGPSVPPIWLLSKLDYSL